MNAAGASIHHRICPFCEACCGLELTIAGGRVSRVRGHDADVFSAGYLCPKGVAITQLHEDPDRLRQPLLKRDGRFVEVGWDEAFAEIERRLPPILAAHGRDAAAMTIGNPAAHKISLLLYGARLAKALGTRNIFTASTLDQMPKQLSCGLMYGGWLSIPVPDIERTDLLIVLGANPVASNGSLWTVPDFRGKAKALQARGGRIVVIDPRRTETADLADRHLFIRPGGDVFLLLGMAQVLFAENLVRLDRLAGHVAGLAELEAAVAPYPPEVVAARCGIEAAAIRELAREFAAAPRAAFHSRIGSCTQDYGTLACWLVDAIAILAGHFDTEGGLMFSRSAAFAANTLGKPGVGRGVVTGRHKSRVSGAPEVYGELPMGCLAEEIETPGTGQVRALVTVGSNPVLSGPNGARLAAALEGLDFMVSLDVYLNETTRHADVILPGRSPLEDGHYDVAFPQFSFRNHARYSPPVFAAPAGQPAEWEILLRLAAIATGRGAGVDVQAMDDELFAADVQRQAGPLADAVLGALASRRGPERLIDYALRGGPYGDGFGARPGGLSLAKVEAAPGGIDLGPLAPGGIDLGPHRAGAAHAAGRSRPRQRRPRAAGARPGERYGDCRPPPRALEQQLDAQPAAAGEGAFPLHGAGAPWRRGAARPRQRRPRAHQRQCSQHRSAGRGQRRNDAGRGQPAPRLGSRPAGNPVARRGRAARRQPQCPVRRKPARSAVGQCRALRRDGARRGAGGLSGNSAGDTG